MSISDRILLVASIIIALGVIATAFKRIRNFLRKFDRMTILLEDMTTHLSDAPNAFKILADIVSQFGVQSGSSLKDEMDSVTASITNLTEVARSNKVAGIVLENQIEALKEIAQLERHAATAERARMMQLLQQLEGKVALADSIEALKTEKRGPNVDSQ